MLNKNQKIKMTRICLRDVLPKEDRRQFDCDIIADVHIEDHGGARCSKSMYIMRLCDFVALAVIGA